MTNLTRLRIKFQTFHTGSVCSTNPVRPSRMCVVAHYAVCARMCALVRMCLCARACGWRANTDFADVVWTCQLPNHPPSCTSEGYPISLECRFSHSRNSAPTPHSGFRPFWLWLELLVLCVCVLYITTHNAMPIDATLFCCMAVPYSFIW